MKQLNIKYFSLFLLCSIARATTDVNSAQIELLNGDYVEGFAHCDERLAKYPALKKPWTDGFNPSGKRVLVRCEQGFGETFLFMRYVQALKQAGATVIVLVQDQLKTMIQETCPYVDMVVTNSWLPESYALPEFDADVYIMSLPRYLSRNGQEATTLATVPNHVPYMFSPAKTRKRWSSVFANDKNFKIGVCWRSSDAANSEAGKASDIPLRDLVAALSGEGISLYAIQDGSHRVITQHDIDARTVRSRSGDQDDVISNDVKISYFDSSFDVYHGLYVDTAAVMMHMDLVVTVNGPIANLAGAMGVATITLLGRDADWRWIQQGSEPDWFPQAYLLKQQAPHDWNTVLADLSSIVHMKAISRR